MVRQWWGVIASQAVFGIAALTLIVAPDRAAAADLGGDCCADLEERIAELEATTARKGNRKVSLTVQGQIHQAVLFWDDGEESNAYVVGNKNDQSNFHFSGDATVSKDVSVGYVLLIRLNDNLSDAVDQFSDDASPGSPFEIRESNFWVESKTLGKLSVGEAPRVTDTYPERDLSGTGAAAYSGVQDIGGSFFLRRSDDNTLSGVAWGDLINHLNGDTGNLVRYDTPALMGFTLSASWGEDDIWDVGAAWEGEGGGFKAEAAIGYTEVTDNDDPEFGGPDQSTIVGSFAIIHEATGLNALVAAGRRDFDDTALDADGEFRTPEEASYIYGKLGWLAKLNTLGPTGFYGEYSYWEDFLSVVDDPDVVASLGSNLASIRIRGSEAEVWGFGVVQEIEAASMQVYLGYRNYSADIDLADGDGNRSETVGVEDFDTVVAGSRITF